MGSPKAPVSQATQHPHNVQPWGNYLFAQGKDTRNAGLGRLRALDDEFLMQVLALLPAETLGRLACVNRAFYCFSNHEDLWRALTLEAPELEGKWRFKNTWQQTYLKASLPIHNFHRKHPLRVQGFYSDLLYQPWHCTTVPLHSSWLKRDTIDRRTGLSVEDFKQQYELPNKPVILQNTIDDWPALLNWNSKYLKKVFKGNTILAGDYPMGFDNFLAYSQRSRDEMPLYLFDKHFASKAPQLAADYKVPKYFDEDLFSVLGEAGRPDFRWLIMGPPRSGSTFHKDPNATSAWNAVVTGSKKWIMYPPSALPPGQATLLPIPPPPPPGLFHRQLPSCNPFPLLILPRTLPPPTSPPHPFCVRSSGSVVLVEPHIASLLTLAQMSICFSIMHSCTTCLSMCLSFRICIHPTLHSLMTTNGACHVMSCLESCPCSEICCMPVHLALPMKLAIAVFTACCFPESYACQSPPACL
ncbi:TPA: hypothetical protein ACH3X1_011187 [Trebouxia sp. C0004]